MTNKGLPSEFIEKVKLANNIVNVASRYFRVTAKGRTHWAACPFHHEKTPSFAINETGQYYHCFGCGASGNVIGLVMQCESVGFMDAMEILAKAAGLEMPHVINDDGYAELAKKKQRLLGVLDAAREYYCKQLTTDSEKAREALDYLHNRGITDDLIKLFNIGLSPDWDSVLSVLRKKGFTDAELTDAGVAAKNDRGRLYDAMGGRITFAIFDIYGNCIGFQARTLSTEKDVAKYRNTAQTMVFDKSNIVYGIDVLKKNKLANFVDKLIVVEGNVDVVSLVGAGFTNTVACMGTALTQYHARIFKRFSEQVYVCFDGDEAGQKAATRSLDILTGEGLQVRVIELPDGLDPDDFIRKRGKEAFGELIESAKPLIDFKLDYLAKKSNLRDNLGKTAYLKAAAEILKPLADTVELELYVPKVAEAGGVSTDAVLRHINKGTKAVKPVAASPKPVVPKSNAHDLALEFVVASLVHGKDYADPNEIPEIDNALYDKLVRERIKVNAIFDVFEGDEAKQLENIINFPFTLGEIALEKQYRDSVNYLLTHKLKQQKAELTKKHSEAETDDEKAEIEKQLQQIDKRIKDGKAGKN